MVCISQEFLQKGIFGQILVAVTDAISETL